MKRIAIIGGGISGLTVLHYLKQRLNDSVEITLYESQERVGGTVRTMAQEGCMFECGPNAFLDSQPATLELIGELGLNNQLIAASSSAHRRYIQLNRQLYPVPMDPITLIKTPLISRKDKWSLMKGLFKKNISQDSTIYDYISRRFSSGIAESLIDPMIAGIYAGDIKRLHMASAFPKFKRGSKMFSLAQGMGQIIEALFLRYQSHIETSTEVSLSNNTVIPAKAGPHTGHSLMLGIQDPLKSLDADIKVVATPAYAAARLLQEVNLPLAKSLVQIPYAPVVVVGLCCEEKSFKKTPDGFGYLIPRQEHKDILGVLIESNIFPNRAEVINRVMLRVMMGGRHHRELTHKDQKQLIEMAVEEIESVYGLKAGPDKVFIKIWPQAIPQYEMNYPQLSQSIAQECAKTPGLYLCANYLGGISFNDCVSNAKSLAYRIGV